MHYACNNLYTRTGWTVQGSNPGGGEIFHTRPVRPWGLLSHLHDGYRLSFLRLKRPGRGVNHPPLSSAEVKEGVKQHLYTAYGPSWPVLGRTLPLPLPFYINMSPSSCFSNKSPSSVRRQCRITFNRYINTSVSHVQR